MWPDIATCRDPPDLKMLFMNTSKVYIHDLLHVCIMYLLNRKVIFGKRYQPKRNFVSSKIKFSFVFGNFGALLQSTRRTYLNHSSAAWPHWPLVSLTIMNCMYLLAIAESLNDKESASMSSRSIQWWWILLRLSGEQTGVQSSMWLLKRIFIKINHKMNIVEPKTTDKDMDSEV